MEISSGIVGGPGNGASHMLVLQVLQSMWGAVCNVLGQFGLRPVYLLFAVVGVVVISLVLTVVQAVRGKTKFTLDPVRRDEV